jgi:hypothetical protein
METYVIRIYRRHATDPERLDGLLEAVEGEASQAFHGRDELWSLLLSPTGSEADHRAGDASGAGHRRHARLASPERTETGDDDPPA